MSEATANDYLEAAAAERARWAAVLAKPAGRGARMARRPAGVLARLLALFTA